LAPAGGLSTRRLEHDCARRKPGAVRGSNPSHKREDNMKTVTTLFLGLTLAVMAPAALHAQTPLSVEVQAGVVVPTGDFADDFATTGFGFGINAAYRVMPMLDIYAGYSWQRFGVDEGDFEDVDVDVDDSGFALGARFNFAMPALSPWVRGGLIFHELKVSGSEGGFSASFSSDRTLGFEAGGGIAYPLAPNIDLTPALMFRTYKPEFDGESSESSVSYFGLFLGGRISF
jgi:opacity protein-like surface antigen